MVAIVLFINRIAYRQLVALSTISFHEPENHTLLSKTLSLCLRVINGKLVAPVRSTV